MGAGALFLWWFSVWLTVQWLQLGFCALCALQNSAYYWSFVLMTVLCVAYSTVITAQVLCPVWFTEQCLLLELCSLCALQNSAYYWSFVLMIVLCVVYRTVLTPGALFSVCFTEQRWLLELCSHDCSLCGLQNNAYYWSFSLMIVLWFTEQWLLLGLHSFCGLLHQPPPVHTTRLVACLPLSSFPAMFYCFSSFFCCL